MDRTEPVSPEHASDGRSRDHSRLSEITYRDADRFSVEDTQAICPVLLEARRAVNGEDLSRQVTYSVNGREILVPEVEATLYAYYTNGCQVRLALQSNELIAIMIYLRVFDDTIALRLSYVKPTHRRLGVSHDLVDLLNPKPKIVLFQTRTSLPPEQVHTYTKARRTKFSEGPHLENWMMNWETGDKING